MLETEGCVAISKPPGVWGAFILRRIYVQFVDSKTLCCRASNASFSDIEDLHPFSTQKTDTERSRKKWRWVQHSPYWKWDVNPKIPCNPYWPGFHQAQDLTGELPFEATFLDGRWVFEHLEPPNRSKQLVIPGHVPIVNPSTDRSRNKVPLDVFGTWTSVPNRLRIDADNEAGGSDCLTASYPIDPGWWLSCPSQNMNQVGNSHLKSQLRLKTKTMPNHQAGFNAIQNSTVVTAYVCKSLRA